MTVKRKKITNTEFKRYRDAARHGFNAQETAEIYNVKHKRVHNLCRRFGTTWGQLSGKPRARKTTSKKFSPIVVKFKPVKLSFWQKLRAFFGGF